MAFGWLKKAVRAAGKPLKKIVKVAVSPVKLVAKAGRTVGKQLGKVPIVGGGLKGVFDLTLNAPFQVAGKIASGDRIDKVALSSLRAHVQSVKGVAPYAQTVISIVPAIGPGINAGIGAGLALASGQPISVALAEGVKSALPGGPLAKAIFSAGQAVVDGKPVSSILINSLPIDAQAKRGVSVALSVTSRLARGERVDKVLLSQADHALKLLPADARKALQIGTAVGQAQRLQKIASQHVSTTALSKLKQGGTNLIRTSPILSSASTVLKSTAARTGYSVGMGVLQTHNPQPFHVAAIRNRLGAEQRQGFDMAVATRSGMVKTNLAAPQYLAPSQQLGFYTTAGISATSTAPAIIKAVRTTPATQAGSSVAIALVRDKRPTFWQKFKVYLFGEK